jgi:hypothetical protein
MLRVVTIVLAVEERVLLSGNRAEQPISAASRIIAAHT